MVERASTNPPTREQELEERASRLQAMFARGKSEQTDEEPHWDVDDCEADPILSPIDGDLAQRREDAKKRRMWPLGVSAPLRDISP